MTEIYRLVEKAQKSDQEAIQQIIYRFEPKIKSSLRLIPFQQREDVNQEIVIKMIEVIQKEDIERVPGFKEFLNTISL
ncbi:helix-turn-helix domain-containing protein [Bacillus sp. FJAT-44742]|uniref:helix-turn-helix domain-containing protein n=1 Tax=Bacillus sp. FJAT-44742 TaxID=2014005 RepID=UPI000C24450E|nr:helix-turn-helix domain-containing protein [Bacillus sp. FJAT-44742]